MIRILITLIVFVFTILFSFGQKIEKKEYQTLTFGERGQIKMLYDRRQRPQSVFLNGKIHVVFNAGSEAGEPGKSKSKPMIVTYNPASREFSDVVTLGSGKSDHHYCPVIWTDSNDFLHVLYGCHTSAGTHLISNKPGIIGTSLDDWNIAPEIAPSISYPTFYRVSGGRELIYYRTAGHISSWTYRFSDDNGSTWVAPKNDVIDLDSKGRFEWSSYQSKLPDKGGRYLHVVFAAYDDNRQDEPERFYNSKKLIHLP